MTTGAIFPKMVRFALPVLLAGVLQLLFNAADVIVVGKFAGDNSLAAVGSTTSYVNLLVNLFVGLSIGTNVLCARYFGARDEKNLAEAVHTSIGMSLVCGLIMGTIGFTMARPMMALMKSPVLDLSTTYLRMYFLGMPGLLLYNFGSAVLRAKGDTKRPLYYLIIAGIVNVGLNLFFVIVWHMDVAGVGLATAISYYVSATLILITLIREDGAFKLHLSRLSLKGRKLAQILQVGLPAGIQGVLFSISNMIIQSSVNGFGEIVVAGNSAAQSIEGFVYISMNAFYQAAMSFTSQNVGAGKYDRVPKILNRSLLSVTVVGLFLSGIVVIFSHPLSAIYTNTEAAIAASTTRLLYICIPYFLCGIMDTFSGVIRGLGHSIVPMVVTLIGACLFRVIWIFTIFQIPTFHTIECVYISYPISWVLTTIAHIISYILVTKRDKTLREGLKV